MLCTSELAANNPEWAGDYIKSTCVVQACAEAPIVLGVHLGGLAVVDRDMTEITEKVDRTRLLVEKMNCPPAELTLQMTWLNLSKATYLMRCNGDRISQERLTSFDRGMASGVESALWGPLPADSWIQATVSVDAGGIGLRQASTTNLAASIASRTASQPLVEEMAKHTEEAGICSADTLMKVFSDRTQVAVDSFLGTLPEAVRSDVVDAIADAHAAAYKRCQSWCAGAESGGEPFEDGNAAAEVRQPGAGIIGEVGSGDVEFPGNANFGSALHLQQKLTRARDRCEVQGLVNRWRSLDSRDDL